MRTTTAEERFEVAEERIKRCKNHLQEGQTDKIDLQNMVEEFEDPPSPKNKRNRFVNHSDKD